MGSRARTSAPTLTGFVLRVATSADVAEVAALERGCYSDPWPRSAFLALPDDPRVFFAVARGSDGALAGYVVGWYVLDEAEIANLAVAPSDRGKGVGRALLDAVLNDAESRGVADVYLEVRRSNTAALKLYRSRGFEQVGMRKGYYRTPVEDALILRYTLKR
jgi:ribosomal-protein-alanine N-acetyltransferase